MANWTKTSDSVPAHRNAVAIFPPWQGHEFACWNEYEQCWDGDDGDDFLCHKSAVFCWYEIPEVPAELKAEYSAGDICPKT
jgi:hypothetical protein